MCVYIYTHIYIHIYIILTKLSNPKLVLCKEKPAVKWQTKLLKTSLIINNCKCKVQYN